MTVAADRLDGRVPRPEVERIVVVAPTGPLVLVDGHDVPLGALDTALVAAVLAASATMRHRRAYKILLHVKAGVVHVELTRHLREVPYSVD